MAKRPRALTPAQVFALALGVVYLVAALMGFALTGFDDFAGVTPEKLVVFHVNPLHNIVHLVLGAGWLATSGDRARAARVNLVFGAVLLGVGLLGLVDNPLRDAINVHGSSDADNFLHLGTGAAAVLFGTTLATRRPVAAY